MTDEVITEDTPDDGVEMLEYKLEAMSKRCEMLAAQKEVSQEYNNKLRCQVENLEDQVRYLTNHMTVRQLRDLGAKVTITFSNVDEDYD